MKKRIHLWLGGEALDKLRMISTTYDVSLSGAIRICISAAYTKLGFDKNIPDDA